jgi:hypothetical protein
MSRISGVAPMSNYSTFKEQFKKSGYSSSNFYDVTIELDSNPKLIRQLSKDPQFNLSSTKQLLRLYCDEATMPGLQMSTGDYRITNTPNLKYAYGAVFSGMELSFMMDADSQIKNLFDLWTNWIYGYANQKLSLENLIGIGSPQQNFRAAYRDDYTVDIIIVKYERSMNGTINGREPTDKRNAYSFRDIIPDISDKQSIDRTKFYKAIPVHATKIFNAFPSNISSVSLSREETSISKLGVSFEYETFTTTTLNSSSALNFRDPINGGSGLDVVEALVGLLA